MLRSSRNPYDYRPSQSTIDGYSALKDLAMNPTDRRSPRQTTAVQEEEWDRRRQISRRSTTEPSPNRALSRSPSSNALLQSMIVEGQWRYREDPDDNLRLKSMGIKYLVAICHDIMAHTLQSTNRIGKRRREEEGKPLARGKSWPMVQLDRFQRLSNGERVSLHQAGLLEIGRAHV